VGGWLKTWSAPLRLQPKTAAVDTCRISSSKLLYSRSDVTVNDVNAFTCSQQNPSNAFHMLVPCKRQRLHTKASEHGLSGRRSNYGQDPEDGKIVPCDGYRTIRIQTNSWSVNLRCFSHFSFRLITVWVGPIRSRDGNGSWVNCVMGHMGHSNGSRNNGPLFFSNSQHAALN